MSFTLEFHSALTQILTFKTMLFQRPLTLSPAFLKSITIRRRATDAHDVIFQNVGDKGIVTLSRPKAFNALNLSMLNKLYPALEAWQREKTFVIIKGAGGKAFCAGGDVKSMALAGMKGENLGQAFLKQQYKTVGLMGSYKIPCVALIEGIVMGGGVGLSVHGPYRVATETSLFAMPETQIGLFPGAGGSYFLPKMRGKLGLFLALTGHRLEGADLLRAGIATHYVESRNLDDLEADLLECGDVRGIEGVLRRYSAETGGRFSLEGVLGGIDDCFGAESVEGIVERLEKDGSDWAKDTLTLLGKKSPTSLKLAFRQFQFGAGMSLQECLRTEYRIEVGLISNKDFYEGVRALLIDKDHNPKWNPSTLSEVGASFVESFWKKLPNNEEL